MMNSGVTMADVFRLLSSVKIQIPAVTIAIVQQLQEQPQLLQTIIIHTSMDCQVSRHANKIINIPAMDTLTIPYLNYRR